MNGFCFHIAFAEIRCGEACRSADTVGSEEALGKVVIGNTADGLSTDNSLSVGLESASGEIDLAAHSSQAGCMLNAIGDIDYASCGVAHVVQHLIGGSTSIQINKILWPYQGSSVFGNQGFFLIVQILLGQDILLQG